MKSSPLRTADWLPDTAASRIPGALRIVDQTKLPGELCFLDIRDIETAWTAIHQLQVRGAPAIGVAAAFALLLSIQHDANTGTQTLLAQLRKAAAYLAESRPTAVNLFWAIERMLNTADASSDLGADAFVSRLLDEATAIRDEDAAMCHAIGRHGLSLLSDGMTILTHCNAGGLATSEYGTALAPIYEAHSQGMNISVYADETRPLLQGARLTTWELMQAGIPTTLICDNMAAHTMKLGRIDAVFVGSDRIAANGDAANKIGTYGLALLAKAHNIPFYVLAPSSTVDHSLATGDDIPIEERDPKEVTEGFGTRTAPHQVAVFAPAFDVTPQDLITAIVTEQGVLHGDYIAGLAALRSPSKPGGV